ncbi:hypothetical protein ACFPN2_05285 [Steroidobacter flavus]|uniref:Lipoprotein n=1 Tax=Steroidobacter flavus TaxID=1842136 RepID=A0ABV8SQ26_9GAMM
MNMKLLLATMLALLGCSSAFAGEKTEATMDKMKAAVTPGEIDLTGQEVKTIHDSQTAKDYKVCVKASNEAAAMKLRYDGQEATVQPGDCKEVTAKRINATAATPLSGSQHIMATFHEVKK